MQSATSEAALSQSSRFSCRSDLVLRLIFVLKHMSLIHLVLEGLGDSGQIILIVYSQKLRQVVVPLIQFPCQYSMEVLDLQG